MSELRSGNVTQLEFLPISYLVWIDGCVPHSEVPLTADSTLHVEICQPSQDQNPPNAVFVNDMLTAMLAMTAFVNLIMSRVPSVNSQLLPRGSLPSVKTLRLSNIVSPDVFILACPNLTTFGSDYPFRKPKAILKAIVETGIARVELRNHAGWKAKHIGGSGELAFMTKAC